MLKCPDIQCCARVSSFHIFTVKKVTDDMESGSGALGVDLQTRGSDSVFCY